MAVRQSFTALQQPQDDSQFDPASVFGMPMPAQPNMPMDNGTQQYTPQSFSPVSSFAPQSNFQLFDENTGQNIPPPTSAGYDLPPGIETFAAPPSLPQPGQPPAPTSFTPAPGFTNTSPVKPSTPTNVPDPSNPGYDTAGFKLGSYIDANGNLHIPQGNGQEAVTPKGTLNTQLAPAPPATGSGGGATSIGDPSGLGGAVSGGLQKLIGANGLTPEQTSLLAYVNQIISGGGALLEDDAIVQAQLEKARENESQAFTAQLGDTRDELAARGLIGEPGVPQGLEGEGLQEINRVIAPQYSQAIRDINTNASQQREQRLMSAISTATGITGSAAQQLLTSLGQGTQRQLGLAQIALDSLGQDMQWNEFLANYGLQRDQILNSIQQGNSQALQTLIALFLQFAGLTSKGHV